jgi:hypothetical protein
VSEPPLPDVPAQAPTPPAADITGALAKTEHALAALNGPKVFERIAVACLETYVPALRNTGGAGDEQRDGVGGPLFADNDRIVLTASLERAWAKKVEHDLDGLAKHGRKPDLVLAVSNRKTGAKRRNELIIDTRAKRGYKLQIVDVEFLALRLLSAELLAIREELLGLPVPQLPVAVSAAAFGRRQPDFGANERLVGRAEEIDQLIELLRAHVVVEVIGPGGIGKTRLALAAHDRIDADRTLFLDDRARLDSDLLSSELAGADRLTLVVDNAHRRQDLRQVVGLLFTRTGDTRLILIARPGFDGRLREAIEGTAFDSPRMTGQLTLKGLTNKDIGDLVRTAKPPLEFEGSVERIVALAEGNPLIALLAHRAACSPEGVYGLSLNKVLADYARSAVATAVAGRTDVQADDLRDLLAVLAALGPVGPSEEGLVSSLLAVPVRAIRHRIDDLADVGLLTASGEQNAISPDLLAAHILHESYLSGNASGGVRYREIWDATDESRRDQMCQALGALQGFEVNAGTDVSTIVADALVELAATNPSRALRRAQSVAIGVPGIAIRTVDAALQELPKSAPERHSCLLIAMEVLSRVSDVSAGWPRQLAVAQAYFAAPGTDEVTKQILDSLTTVYKRLPMNISAYDGHVLAQVQTVLADATTAHWRRYRGESGCARTIATAAGQLLSVMSQTAYASAEDEMRIHLRAGFVPASERTAAVLRAGSSLLRESLPELELEFQQSVLQPIAALRRTARGTVGPYGAMPSSELANLTGEVLAELTKHLSEMQGLPLPTRAGLIEVLGTDPWPEDDELRQFYELLNLSSPRERRTEQSERVEHQAAGLLACEDITVELHRWEAWLTLAEQAHMRHAGRAVTGRVMHAAAQSDPERLAPALESVIADGGPLADHAGAALGELAARADGEALMRRLAVNSDAVVRVAVAAGLRLTADAWADLLLEELADDPDQSVRAAVACTAGWTKDGSSKRLRTGLRACLPADLSNALELFTGAESRSQPEGLAPLDGDFVTIVTELGANAACQSRIDGHELIELGELAGLPRLVIETCLARIRWLADNPAKDFAEAMARDGLPDELADAARTGANDQDRLSLMTLLEEPDLDGEASNDAIKLLAWIDDYDAVTDHIPRWLDSDIEQLKYRAFKLLHETRDSERFKQRALKLIAAEPTVDLSNLLLEAREPTWHVGSEEAVNRRLADEFGGWVENDDERLAAIGRKGVERFGGRSKNVTGSEEDHEIAWG